VYVCLYCTLYIGRARETRGCRQDGKAKEKDKEKSKVKGTSEKVKERDSKVEKVGEKKGEKRGAEKGEADGQRSGKKSKNEPEIYTIDKILDKKNVKGMYVYSRLHFFI
jgi:hypothetical protein